MFSKVAAKEAEKEQKDWWEVIKISPHYQNMRDEIFWTLYESANKWDRHLGTIKTVRHEIELNEPDDRPVHSGPYHASSAARKFQKDNIDKMKKMRVIEPAQTEWASPVVFYPINDGALGFCVDYRKLNSLTFRDVYRIPLMDECIDSVAGYRFYDISR